LGGSLHAVSSRLLDHGLLIASIFAFVSVIRNKGSGVGKNNYLSSRGAAVACSASVASLAIISAPVIRGSDSIAACLWIHHIGIVLLGAFLVAAAYLQTDLWIGIFYKRDIYSLRSTCNGWWCLTELVPAPAAIMILMSGLGLLYQIPGFSVERGWIFMLLLILGAMMSDGILGYTPEVRSLARDFNEAGDHSPATRSLVFGKSGLRRQIRLLLHPLTFPMAIVIPAIRVWDTSSPVNRLIRILHLPNDTGWSRVWPALLVFSISFITVAFISGITDSLFAELCVEKLEAKFGIDSSGIEERNFPTTRRFGLSGALILNEYEAGRAGRTGLPCFLRE
jgi:hypothetical protein